MNAKLSTAGLGELLRLALRRDRIMLPVWIYALVGSVASTLVSIRHLYPDDASRDRQIGRAHV